MHKHTIWTLIILFIVIIGISFFVKKDIDVSNTTDSQIKSPTEEVSTSTPKTASYKIDGETYSLVDGTATKSSAPDSVSVNTLSLFGEPVFGDLDGDKDDDAVVLLSLTTGGSGIFYYAALVRNMGGVYESTNTLFLGDRIAPQTVEILEGHAVYNYAERRADEPMSAQPSMAKTLWIQLDKATSEIGEWVKDFEGEVYASALKLDLHPWVWLRTEYKDKPVFVPKETGSFLLTFDSGSTFRAQTDCNGLGGSFAVNGNSLKLSKMMATLMYCEGSDESSFSDMLTNVSSYSFGIKGELILTDETGNVKMIFQ